jgi:transposase
MPQVEYIRDLYENEEMSLREIARQTKHHFVTVQKYAYRANWNQQGEPQTRQRDFPVMQEYISIVDEWLEQDEREPRKQRHTITKVYNRLKKEHSYTGSYNSVKRYYNYKKAEMKKYKESFLPLAHPPGSVQVDFGDFKYYDALERNREGHALIVSFPNSNVGWMQVFPAENQECLLTGLKRIFYHIGGVPVRLRCDNMSTAVVQILEGTERVITDGFYRFMLHHRFKADFCNPGKGNEKGNVENKVGYTRRNMLVPVPTIIDFDAFNEELLRLCDEDQERVHYERDVPIKELWEEEKQHLLTLPEYEYEVFSIDYLKADKYGFIRVDTTKYGLSPELADKVVQVKAYFDKIEVSYDHCLLKTFRRSYEKKGEDSDWKDYLPSLVKKPGATEHTRFFNQMPKLWQNYLKSVTGRERKSALMLLSEIVQDGNESLCDDALELAGEHGALNSDNIRACYLFISKPEYAHKPLQLASSPPLLNYRPDLSVYDSLTGGVPR